jgi:hypothetical protein
MIEHVLWLCGVQYCFLSILAASIAARWFPAWDGEAFWDTTSTPIGFRTGGAPAGLQVGKMEELNPSHQGMTGEVEIGTPGVKKLPVLYQQMRNHIK